MVLRVPIEHGLPRLRVQFEKVLVLRNTLSIEPNLLRLIQRCLSLIVLDHQRPGSVIHKMKLVRVDRPGVIDLRLCANFITVVDDHSRTNILVYQRH